MTEAEQIIAKLIDDKQITGEEAVILFNACKHQIFIPTNEKKD